VVAKPSSRLPPRTRGGIATKTPIADRRAHRSPPGGGERAGRVGRIPAIRIAGLGHRLVAGVTTSERNFRYRDIQTLPEVASAYADLNEWSLAFGGWLGVDQVHGSTVLDVAESLGENLRAVPGPLLGTADGMVLRPRRRSARKRLDQGDGDRLAGGETVYGPRLLTVTVADCVPVFLSWPGGYGILHAGWRGTAAGILENGLRSAAADPARVRVHLGPAIGGCCYRVGPEVVEAVWNAPPNLALADARCSLRRAGADRFFLDLRSALTWRALAAGVSRENLTVSASCTACDPRFHSFRRSGARTATHLMLAFIGSRSR
jgi:copper oxidase (laccase) domain-containing protein